MVLDAHTILDLVMVVVTVGGGLLTAGKILKSIETLTKSHDRLDGKVEALGGAMQRYHTKLAVLAVKVGHDLDDDTPAPASNATH